LKKTTFSTATGFFAQQRPDATSTHANQPGTVNFGIQQVPELLIAVLSCALGSENGS
jgi:hypothetical protein